LKINLSRVTGKGPRAVWAQIFDCARGVIEKV